MKHTQGKWEAMQEDLGLGHKGKIVIIHDGPDGLRTEICTLNQNDTPPIETEANARLIVAAPAMLEELKSLIFLEKTAMTKRQVKMAIGRAKDLLDSLDL